MRAVISGMVALSALVIACLVSYGAPASADVPGLETKSASGTATANSVKSLAVTCSAGKKALGGGVEVPTSGLIQILASVPQGATGDGSDNANGWLGEYLNNDSTERTVTVWVVCATIGA